MASAPPPKSVTKQQGTIKLSNVPLPKSAAAAVQVLVVPASTSGRRPFPRTDPLLLASKHHSFGFVFFLLWTQYKGHMVLERPWRKNGVVAEHLCSRFSDLSQLILLNHAVKGWQEAQGGKGPPILLPAALSLLFWGTQAPQKWDNPPPLPTKQMGTSMAAEGAPVRSLLRAGGTV